jgi:hypothetical protein
MYRRMVTHHALTHGVMGAEEEGVAVEEEAYILSRVSQAATNCRSTSSSFSRLTFLPSKILPCHQASKALARYTAVSKAGS